MSSPCLKEVNCPISSLYDTKASRLTRINALALPDATATAAAAQMSDDDADIFFLFVQLLGHRAQDRHVRQAVETILP